jgi:hypothetical protein
MHKLRASYQLDLAPDLGPRFGPGDPWGDAQRSFLEAQSPSSERLRTAAAALPEDADFAVRASLYLSMLPGF